MAEFNAHKWFKNQYLMYENDDPKIGDELEAGLDGTGVMENKSDLYSALSTAIPEDTNYKDFAKAIAKMLIDDYGSHNFSPFMKVLHAELGIDESLNEAEDGFADFISKLEADPDNKYLKFIEKGDEIRVGGRQGDLQDFIIKYEEQDLGPYKLFSTDDDDRGWIVRISKK